MVLLSVVSVFTFDKGRGTCFCPCLSVCLSVSKITQKRVHGFGWNVACRQMSGLLVTAITVEPFEMSSWDFYRSRHGQRLGWVRKWLHSDALRQAGDDLTLYGHIKTAEQPTIIQQYGDWYTGRWRVGCYIWYSEEGPGWAAAPPSLLLAVPNVTARPVYRIHIIQCGTIIAIAF